MVHSTPFAHTQSALHARLYDHERFVSMFLSMFAHRKVQNVTIIRSISHRRDIKRVVMGRGAVINFILARGYDMDHIQWSSVVLLTI